MIRWLNPHKWMLACWHFAGLLAEFPRDVASLGWSAAWRVTIADIEHWLRRVLSPNGLAGAPRSVVVIRLRGYRHPLAFRRNTSDRFIVRQVFREAEYGCIAADESLRVFVDGGANIGCTSFFLLQRFPQSQAIVIEPDDENMALCRRNLAPFGERVRYLSSALWSKSTPLKIVQPARGQAQESMISVVECPEGDVPDLDSVSLADVMPSPVDLVKLDIEGAEREIFDHGSSEWIDRTRNLIIELHGPEARKSFQRVLSHFDFESSESGELTYCRNLRRRGVRVGETV
jgi:FkbM family methyltransferase